MNNLPLYIVIASTTALSPAIFLLQQGNTKLAQHKLLWLYPLIIQAVFWFSLSLRTHFIELFIPSSGILITSLVVWWVFRRSNNCFELEIGHIGLWTKNLEKTKQFYIQYFNAQANTMYHNSSRGFSSYFLTFKGTARLELMHQPNIPPSNNGHIAFKLKNKGQLDKKVDLLKKQGIAIINGPRQTGDGYYEAVLADPEGNLIELTC